MPIYVDSKHIWKFVVATILLVLTIWWVWSITRPVAVRYLETLNCSLFATHGEAQTFFNQAPERYGKLDRDGDGVACESLP